LPNLLHSVLDVVHILNIHFVGTVYTDCYLIHVVGNTADKFKKFLHILGAEFHDKGIKECDTHKLTLGLVTAELKLLLKEVVFFLRQPNLNTPCSLDFFFHFLSFLFGVLGAEPSDKHLH
jgi:hypothetical protein